MVLLDLGVIAVVEAAQLDGASYSRELWRVSLPIVAPGAAAAALICFIFAWNEYFLANLLTAVVARTTPPFLGSFVDGRGQFLAILSAASTIAVLPVIVAGWRSSSPAPANSRCRRSLTRFPGRGRSSSASRR
jgi:sorbitol/mannitol transport system permease protein